MHILISSDLFFLHVNSYTVPEQENNPVSVILTEAKCSACEDSASVKVLLTYKYTILNKVNLNILYPGML